MTSDFFKELTTFLESLATYRCPIVLLADSNINTERQDDVNSKELGELIASFDLKQHVDDATHNLGGCLDLVVTRFDFNLGGCLDLVVTRFDFNLGGCLDLVVTRFDFNLGGCLNLVVTRSDFNLGGCLDLVVTRSDFNVIASSRRC